MTPALPMRWIVRFLTLATRPSTRAPNPLLRPGERRLPIPLITGVRGHSPGHPTARDAPSAPSTRFAPSGAYIRPLHAVPARHGGCLAGGRVSEPIFLEGMCPHRTAPPVPPSTSPTPSPPPTVSS